MNTANEDALDAAIDAACRCAYCRDTGEAYCPATGEGPVCPACKGASMQNPVTLSLFDYRPPQAAPRASEQDRQAARVGKGIDEAVIDVSRRVAQAFRPAPFGMEAFTAAVQRVLAEQGKKCSPDSPRRRLSAIIRQGVIVGRCVDRSRSLWVVEAVR